MERKWVLGFEGLYEVNKNGEVRNNKLHIMSPGKKKDGYIHYVLSKGGKKFNVLGHRAVAYAFLGERNGMIINHKNSIRNDNNVENLERCNNSYNQKHSYANGRIHCRGSLGKSRKKKKY